MTGTQTIDIKTIRCSYHIELPRKITIIKGTSGTGKTTLVQTIKDLSILKHSWMQSSAPVVALSEENSLEDLVNIIERTSNSILCIDESIVEMLDIELPSLINKSTNYFILITRQPVFGIPYSPSAIKVIETDENNRHTFQPLYHTNQGVSRPDVIICEDEASGFQFFSLFSQRHNTVLTARGRDNVFKLAEQEISGSESTKILIIADGSAFGACLDKNMQLHSDNPRVSLYLPESFEYILLHSPIFDRDSIVQEILSDPLSSIDSSFISGEQYFTYAIKTAMKRLGQTYSKSKLNPCFYDLCCYKGKDCPGKVLNRSSTKQAELLRRIGKLDLSNI